MISNVNAALVKLNADWRANLSLSSIDIKVIAWWIYWVLTKWRRAGRKERYMGKCAGKTYTSMEKICICRHEEFCIIYNYTDNKRQFGREKR